jgi:hypothetical protein
MSFQNSEAHSKIKKKNKLGEQPYHYVLSNDFHVKL